MGHDHDLTVWLASGSEAGVSNASTARVQLNAFTWTSGLGIIKNRELAPREARSPRFASGAKSVLGKDGL